MLNARKTTTRRRFLEMAGAGMALGSFDLRRALAAAADLGKAQVLAPKPTHFAPRAKRVVFLFMNGGFSQVDTFDYKPELQKNDNLEVAAEEMFYKFEGKLLRSPYTFQRAGQSGLWVSELFPHFKDVIDDVCVIRSLHSDILEHFQASLQMHTGSATITMPSIGSWLSYGLGSYNPNLPAHVVLANKEPYAGAQGWDNSFLPPEHAGVRIIPGDDPIPNLRSSARSVTLQELEQVMLGELNRRHADVRPSDGRLRARDQSFQVAKGMMRVAPPLFDLTTEPPANLERYGAKPDQPTAFAAQCLITRRLLESGVRVIELVDSGGGSNNWDAHADINDHRRNAAGVDRALKAFLVDLKERGLLDDTLVVINTEFGRTPWRQHNSPTPGRNHWHRAFTCLLAGAGVKGGTTYGTTDQWGAAIVENPCHVHDFHATILHIMGLDHTKLTFRYAGRDFRLTDVYGRVIEDILT
jgi:hypothetical protein